MATIISTAVKLLLDSSGFQAGITEAVAVATQAQQSFESVRSVTTSLLSSAGASLLRSGLQEVVNQLNQIHPLLGTVASGLMTITVTLAGTTAAQNAWTVSIEGTTLAIAQLEAIGIPAFATMGVIIAAAAVALAVFAVQAYEIYQMLKAIKEAIWGVPEVVEEIDKKFADAEKSIDSIQKKIDQFNMSPLEKAMTDLADLGANAEQIDAAANKFRDLTEMIDARKREQDIAKETALAIKEADQAAKETARFREQAAEREKAAQSAINRERIAAEAREIAGRARAADALRNSLMTPAEAFEKKMQDIENLVRVGAISDVTASRAGASAQAELENALKASGSKDQSGPKLLAKGSYDDEIAKSRAKNPIETLTEIQRQQLDEARQTKERVSEVAANTAKFLEDAVNAQF